MLHVLSANLALTFGDRQRFEPIRLAGTQVPPLRTSQLIRPRHASSAPGISCVGNGDPLCPANSEVMLRNGPGDLPPGLGIHSSRQREVVVDETRLEKMAGVAAIVGILFIVVANVQLGSPPKAADPVEKVVAFFSDSRSQILVYAYLFGLGLVLLTVFGAVLRTTLRRAGDTSALPDLVLVAAAWIGAADLVNVGVWATAAFRAPSLDPGAAQALFDASNIGFALLGIPFVILFGAASISALSTRAFPAWIGWLGIATALLNLLKPFTMFARSGGLSPNGGLTIVPLVPIWIWTIAVGVLMIRGVKTRRAES